MAALYLPKTSVIVLPVAQARIVLREAHITARDFNRSRLLIRWKAGYAENGSHARHVANASATNMAATEPSTGRKVFDRRHNPNLLYLKRKLLLEYRGITKLGRIAVEFSIFYSSKKVSSNRIFCHFYRDMFYFYLDTRYRSIFLVINFIKR